LTSTAGEKEIENLEAGTRENGFWNDPKKPKQSLKI
jgi:hypothetical protein